LPYLHSRTLDLLQCIYNIAIPKHCDDEHAKRTNYFELTVLKMISYTYKSNSIYD